jgi:hypothetical protein
MKRKLIYSLLAGLILVVVYSFTLIKPVPKNHISKPKLKQSFSCNAVITSVSKSYSGGSVTISWTYTGSPTRFTYGGYYMCSTGTSFGTTTTYSPSATIPNAACGGTGRIIPLCADNTEGTSMLFTF